MTEGWSLKQAGIVVTSISCLVAYVLTKESSPDLAFFILLLISIILLAVWKCVLYPKVFSPLRHFPQPLVSFKLQMQRGC
jgi:hypothetical protein